MPEQSGGKNWGYRVPLLQTSLQTTVIKQHGAGTKQTHRSMEKDREPRDKPMNLWSIIYDKEFKSIKFRSSRRGAVVNESY